MVTFFFFASSARSEMPSVTIDELCLVLTDAEEDGQKRHARGSDFQTLWQPRLRGTLFSSLLSYTRCYHALGPIHKPESAALYVEANTQPYYEMWLIRF
jgi:hypothetical protein